MVDLNQFILEYRGLKKVVLRTNEYWHECKTMFEISTPANRETMQIVGSHFWGAVKASFLESLFSSINRLTDKPLTGNYKNMTLGRLLKSAQHHLEPQRLLEATELNRKIEQTVPPLRKWRDKYYSHLDYEFIVSGLNMPLFPGKDLIATIDLINNFMTIMSEPDGQMDYSKLSFQGGDGNEVLRKLDN